MQIKGRSTDHHFGKRNKVEKAQVVLQEYVLKGIVDREGEGVLTIFLVRWYEYKEKEYTWKPLDHLPRNFIVDYSTSERLSKPSLEMLRTYQQR